MVRARTRSVLVVLTLMASVLAVPHSPVRARPIAEGVPSAVACDPIDPAACLLPFPNDLFTRPATPIDNSATGKVVNFTPDAMPRSGADVTNGGEGKPIDPTEHNRNDGFSPGSMVMAYVPGLDLHQTWGTADRAHSEIPPNEEGYFDHRDHIADPALYLNDDAPMVIINTETGERHPFWSELDSHRDALVEGERRLLILRPARNFEEGTRYVVGMRNLKDAAGTVIAPSDGPAPTDFVDLRNGSYVDPLRQDHFDSNVFPVLEGAGVARSDLYLAWDFTVASEQNLAGRILSMRDQAFGTTGDPQLDQLLGRLGDTDMANRLVEGRAPAFKIDRIEERVDGDVNPDQPYRRVHGRVTVPNFMDRIQQTEGHAHYETSYAPQMPFDFPAPGSRLLDVDRDGRPEQNPTEPTVQVPFVCDVPTNGRENNVVLYGHGLLGMRDQIFDARRSPGRQGPFFGCAADWWGMSTADAPTVAAILLDVSNFPSLPDRAQQGFLNFMFLGRAAVHPNGFATDAAFQQDGASLINVADDKETPLYYDGNSQGGIMGGALVAVSPDIQRGILGVTGMNYSTLLNRSVDWEGELSLPGSQEDVEELIEDLQDDPADAITGIVGAYSVPFYTLYRDPIERQLVFGLMQMLWDRGESNGYAHHMADDPLPNTPPHDVMLQLAWSDHQVANVSAEVQARTLGAPIMVPGLPDGQHWEMDPYFTETAAYPYDGSALVYWDSGNATPPNGNIPPHHSGDPHGHPRNENAAGWQEAHFLLTGQMADVCDGKDYLTSRHPAVQADGSLRCVAPPFAPGTIVDPEPTETATPTPTATASASASPTEDPGPRATTVTFTENSATSGQFSDPVTLEARVTDTTSGEPVAEREVEFELAGLDSSRTFNVRTDEAGIARVTETLTERPAEYQLTARSGADEDRLGGADSMVFVVDKEDTSLTLDVTGNGSKRAVVAVLTDADSGSGVAERAIHFEADGQAIGAATTDGSGRAEQSVPPRFRGGQHEFAARFDGDDYYQSSTANRST